MNNSDFLSDAVALDLGKSGVKIAETLEIEVNNEWWRLINASDVTEASVFSNRRFIDPVIIGDEIHLEGNLKELGIIYPFRASEFTYQKSSVVVVPEAGAQPVYCYLGHRRTDSYGGYYQLGQWPIIEVKKEDGTVLGVYNPNTMYWYAYNFLFFDSVHNRFIGVSHDGVQYCSTITIGLDGSTPSMSSRTYGAYKAYAPHREVKSFSEKPGYVYSLFYTGGFLYVKETEITPGVNYSTLGTATVIYNDSCIKVDGTAASGGAGWLFFSRAFNSIGVMWRESGGGLRYALQSESFATTYSFPDLTFGGTKKIESVGNFIIPKEGEFIVVKTSTLSTGVLTRPTGWSFPANFVVIGTAEVAENIGVLLGKVGTTLYRLEINLTSMVITKIWAVTLPNEPVSTAEMNLVYAKNGYEIYANSLESGMMFCLNTTSESLGWCFSKAGGDWTTTSLWPYGYAEKEAFIRAGSNIIFVKRYATGSYTPTYWHAARVVDLQSLTTCPNLSSVYALMQTAGITVVNPIKYSYYYDMYGHSPRPSHSIEDDAYYYLIDNAWMANGNQVGVVKFVKPTVTMLAQLYQFSAGYVYGSGTAPIQWSEFLPFGFIEPGHEYSKWTEFQETDGVIVSYVCANNSSSTDYYLLVVNGVNVYGANGMYSRAATGPFIGTYTGRYLRYPSPLGEKHSRLIFNGGGTTFGIDGASFTEALTTCAGYSTRVTLPFTYGYGILGTISKKFYALSNITEGDISWARFHAKEGLEREVYAVRASNLAEVYVIKGIEISGGWADANFQGRIITGVTGTGKTVAVDLQAADDEGYSGSSGGEEATSYVYQYYNRQFIPYPFAREGIRAELSNISKTTKITLPETQEHLIRGMLAAGTDFRGSRCILRRIFPDHVADEGSDIVLLDGYIQDWSYVPEKAGIAFTVSKTLIDVGGQFPKRLMNMGCSHVFKGSRCQYLGEEGRCLKTRAFCTSLGNLNQFGGFPWVAARQRRVMWK